MVIARLAIAPALAVFVLFASPPAAVSSAPAVAWQSLLSVEDEIELGKKTQGEVRNQTPVVSDGSVNNYVKGVFNQLARNAGGPKYPYSVSVANYAEINAFALPGGPVWVHRGAIEAAENESQLAGVLAHEVAHISKRHVAELITKQMMAGGLLQLLDRVLPNNRRGQIGEVVGGLAAQGFMLKFSRDAEREADVEGTRIMRQAGWDPRGLAEFLDVLGAQSKRNPSSVEIFLSDHPGAGERAAALRAGGLGSGGRRDSDNFQRARTKLKSMRPAEKMKSR